MILKRKTKKNFPFFVKREKESTQKKSCTSLKKKKMKTNTEGTISLMRNSSVNKVMTEMVIFGGEKSLCLKVKQNKKIFFNETY